MFNVWGIFCATQYNQVQLFREKKINFVTSTWQEFVGKEIYSERFVKKLFSATVKVKECQIMKEALTIKQHCGMR